MAILGIDIGGTKTAVVIGNLQGEILNRQAFPTRPERGVVAFIDDVGQVADELRRNSPQTITAASIAVGGPLDEKTGTLLEPPHLPGWKEINLAQLLQQRLGFPVTIMHDAKAGAWAEWRFGSGNGDAARRLGFITFATGFGFGLVDQGRVMDIPGEIGHWRVADDGPEMFGKRGSLEGVASGAGISLLAEQSGFSSGTSAEELAALARGGDAKARAIFDAVGVQVGRQCARLVDLFGLETIALGTIAVHAGDLLMDRIRETAREEALPHLYKACTIEPARLGVRLGDLASLSAELSRGTGEPTPAADQLSTLAGLANEVLAQPEILCAIDSAADAVVHALHGGKKVLTCGNGGSATDAAHLAEELVGRYRGNRRSWPAINLAADGSVLTCIGNDFGFDDVFYRQVKGLASPGDILVAFTTSGMSENINRAIRAAKEVGVKTIVLTGKSGGPARELADISIHIPHQASERIQELHTFALHAICEAVEGMD